MERFAVLVEAIAYIEENLRGPITQQRIADACHCSLSSLQKLFRYALRHSVGEYVTKRRICCAARDLLETSASVTELALRYQYSAPEVFSRAFAKVWGVTPSAFRRQWRFSGIFPRIVIEEEGVYFVHRKRVDVSELYDALRQAAGTYVLCFDMVHLMEINEISPEAGDLAIVECLRRMDHETPEDMLLFRVGGDEFALVTGLRDQQEAQAVGDRILARNGESVTWKGREIPVSMYMGLLRLTEGPLRYQELFAQLHTVIDRSKGGP